MKYHNFNKATLGFNQNIKVSEALKEGVKRINIPCYSILIFFVFLLPATLFYIFRHDGNNKILIVGCIASFIIGFIGPLIWSLIATVKYKIWAGENVKDIHRFYNEACTRGLIYEGKFLQKLELRSKKQKERLSHFYSRLENNKELIRDLDDSISKETVFKSREKYTILIFSILLFALLFFTDELNTRKTMFLGGISVLCILYSVFKMFRYKFILKVDRDKIIYKDNKEVIYWNDVLDYQSIPGMGNTPSKLIIVTKNDNLELEMNGFGKLKMNRIIRVLNEYKHRFEIRQQVF
ncbi:hypothetical protein [Pseudofulvibacter geojedonensis]|uniref:YokE-like PH domain-containing protein n=1 Tax=Pseudofulvibacter geojedonensis TaxID=1123758 RepID=A0ABW3I035_9FLAO